MRKTHWNLQDIKEAAFVLSLLPLPHLVHHFSYSFHLLYHIACFACISLHKTFNSNMKFALPAWTALLAFTTYVQSSPCLEFHGGATWNKQIFALQPQNSAEGKLWGAGAVAIWNGKQNELYDFKLKVNMEFPNSYLTIETYPTNNAKNKFRQMLYTVKLNNGQVISYWSEVNNRDFCTSTVGYQPDQVASVSVQYRE
jgi:hypothetical protein